MRAWSAILCSLLVFTFASAAGAAEECVLEKNFTLKQRKKKSVRLKAGDTVTILKTGKSTITVRAKKKKRVVKKRSFLAVCKAAAEPEESAPEEATPVEDGPPALIGIMPFSMKARKTSEKKMLGKWSTQLHESLLEGRADVRHLKKNNAERTLVYPKKSAKKLALFKKRAPEGMTHVVSAEVSKKRGRYTVRIFVTDLEAGDVVATSQTVLKKSAKADWAKAVVEEIAPALPEQKSAEPEPVAAEPADEPVAAEGDVVASNADGAAEPAPEAAEEEDEGGSVVPTILYASGGGLAAIAVVSAVVAAVVGTVALLDAMLIMSSVAPSVFAAESKVQRSTVMSYATDGLWGATAVLGVTGVALLLGGVVASILLGGDEEEAPAEESAQLTAPGMRLGLALE